VMRHLHSRFMRFDALFAAFIAYQVSRSLP
jgi:hypothetical protein